MTLEDQCIYFAALELVYDRVAARCKAEIAYANERIDEKDSLGARKSAQRARGLNIAMGIVVDLMKQSTDGVTA